MDILQPLSAILLVLGLLVMALVILRKRGAASFHLPRLAGTGSRRLEVLERVALTPQHALHLVRIGERSLVVATGPSSSYTVCEATPEAGK
ncbi:MAG: flagellar biosynthetic protein FliO [Terriglobia bacterium]